MATAAQRILRLAARQPLIRPRDVEALGIPREHVLRLHRQGRLIRRARGVYALSTALGSENESLAVVAKTVPTAAICLLSALRFHGLTTQAPHEVWIAVDVKAHKPKLASPRIRVVRFSGQALLKGVEEHRIQSVQVKVYSAAKTIADCFKYRNKIGLEVALEALRDGLRTGKARVAEIYEYAKVCRMTRAIRPYLEAMA